MSPGAFISPIISAMKLADQFPQLCENIDDLNEELLMFKQMDMDFSGNLMKFWFHVSRMTDITGNFRFPILSRLVKGKSRYNFFLQLIAHSTCF